jgi:hypothetical protein
VAQTRTGPGAPTSPAHAGTCAETANAAAVAEAVFKNSLRERFSIETSLNNSLAA